jgi:serine/threonine-protein kinase
MSVEVFAGQVIGGKYEIVRRIGRGSMGEVWVATHQTLRQEVAIKLLSTSARIAEVEDAWTAASRFRFEARIAAQLSRRTKHIVQVTDHGEDGAIAYLVMELLEGETLENRMMRRGPLSTMHTAQVLGQIARALSEAHATGIVHRDLKPSNVFLARDEDGHELVKLLDFGIARTIDVHPGTPSFVTREGLVFGTPGYMSPEQASPSSPADVRCDLWSLATLAYEAMCGDLPILGANSAELLSNLVAGRIVPIHDRKPELPAALEGFFATAFAKDIDDRFASAQELSRSFEEAIYEPPVLETAATVRALARVGTQETLSATMPLRWAPEDEGSPGLGLRLPRRLAWTGAAFALLGLATLGTAPRVSHRWLDPFAAARASTLRPTLARPAVTQEAPVVPAPAPVEKEVLQTPAAVGGVDVSMPRARPAVAGHSPVATVPTTPPRALRPQPLPQPMVPPSWRPQQPPPPSPPATGASTSQAADKSAVL